MWIIKDYKMVNLESIDSIEINIGENGNQFVLDFLKNDKVINFFFYKDEEEIKRAFASIVNGLRNNVKVLNI